MADVDLQQLKIRLSKLGVHIDAEPGIKPPPAAWEAHLNRSDAEVEQLLAKCNRVQQALNRPETEAPAGAAAAAATQRSRCSSASAATTAAGRADARRADATAPRPAASQPRSSLLMRAAQKLLVDAQAASEAKQQQPKLPPAPSQKRPPQRSPASAAAAAAAAEDCRSTAVGTLLAQYKEAQAVWSQEKAKLRRDAAASRKKAAALELQVQRLTRQQQHSALDAASLKAALKGRDLQLEESAAHAKQLQGQLARSQEAAAEKLLSLQAERDDLSALLLATLAKLEGVEAVVAAADSTSAAMEDKVRRLEAERQAAVQEAAAARAEAAALRDSQRQLQWQRELLQKMSEVQIRQNKRKSSAIKQLLSSTAAAAAASEKSGCGRTAGARQPGGSCAVLMNEVLTGLLREAGSGAARDGDDDDDDDAGAGRGEASQGVALLGSDSDDDADDDCSSLLAAIAACE